ncbi:MAG: DUF2971 domain-containing protein [Planctomycetes bacterium]|nr:DUF2971 domain-containing protein [Planctomycetota bacterium]
MIFQDKIAADTNRKVGILSLTERNDDILMWSHYADEHKGICIEFRTDIDSSFFVKAEPVAYSKKYPQLNLLEVVTNEKIRAAAPWMLTKSVHWKYEREWRVLDFVAGRGIRTFPAECLSGVYFGCRTPPDEKETVMAWVSAMPHSVAVYQATESPAHFRLDIERIQ